MTEDAADGAPGPVPPRPRRPSTPRPKQGAGSAASASGSKPRSPRTTSKTAAKPSGTSEESSEATAKPAPKPRAPRRKPAPKTPPPDATGADAAVPEAPAAESPGTDVAVPEAPAAVAAPAPAAGPGPAEAERPSGAAATDVVEVPAPRPSPVQLEPVLELDSLTKRFGHVTAVEDVSLALEPGTFTGIVGPNGAGKTTTLSMITGLLRPTAGRVLVAGIDVWKDPARAKRQMGVLPDRLHTFDRLTGAQLLYYTAVLHGLDRATARRRTEELADAFRVEHAMGRLVSDYSSGMLKKIALAAALIHAPRLLVLDEPFESVDPVSAMTVAQILRDFAAAGGTVLLSSHSMELVQRICDHVAVIVEGRLIAGGTVDEVRGDRSLQERFIDLAGGHAESIADLTWLHRFSS